MLSQQLRSSLSVPAGRPLLPSSLHVPRESRLKIWDTTLVLLVCWIGLTGRPQTLPSRSTLVPLSTHLFFPLLPSAKVTLHHSPRHLSESWDLPAQVPQSWLLCYIISTLDQPIKLVSCTHQARYSYFLNSHDALLSACLHITMCSSRLEVQA